MTEERRPPDLLPCPFCGVPVYVYENPRFEYIVRGDHDGRCPMVALSDRDRPYSMFEDDLRACWNRRATVAAAPLGREPESFDMLSELKARMQSRHFFMVDGERLAVAQPVLTSGQIMVVANKDPGELHLFQEVSAGAPDRLVFALGNAKSWSIEIPLGDADHPTVLYTMPRSINAGAQPWDGSVRVVEDVHGNKLLANDSPSERAQREKGMPSWEAQWTAEVAAKREAARQARNEQARETVRAFLRHVGYEFGLLEREGLVRALAQWEQEPKP